MGNMEAAWAALRAVAFRHDLAWVRNGEGELAVRFLKCLARHAPNTPDCAVVQRRQLGEPTRVPRLAPFLAVVSENSA
jgi:hypothetical protein